jgi:4-amino-4-deoxy-L-arabinose transferase-like glycosyltransferase
MAEGALIFTLVLALYALIRADKRPFLAGLAVALAFSTKQSAIILLPIGFLAVCWIPKKNFRRVISNAAFFFAGFILLTYLLNPFLWRQPIAASLEAISQRQALLKQQVGDRERLAPEQVLHTTGERIAVIMAQLSIAPPMFSEVGNYRINTASEEAIYLGFPGHQLGRGPVSAGILLGFFFLGIIAAIRNPINTNYIHRRGLLLILLTLLASVLGIVLTVPLPWQRYSLLLIPLFSIFAGIGLTWGIENSRRIISNGSLSNRLAQILSQLASNSWMS